jgi:hypothetical protein
MVASALPPEAARAVTDRLMPDSETGRPPQAPAWASRECLSRLPLVTAQITQTCNAIVLIEIQPITAHNGLMRVECDLFHRQLASAVTHANAAAEPGDYLVDPRLVEKVYRTAIRLLDSRPVRLADDDPHPWNHPGRSRRIGVGGAPGGFAHLPIRRDRPRSS